VFDAEALASRLDGKALRRLATGAEVVGRLPKETRMQRTIS
jgi:hypothetical protein